MSRDYFRTLGIPMLAGRSFQEDDGPGSEPVMILSETLASTLFPGEDPLGQPVTLWGQPFRVVGVSAKVDEAGLGSEGRPAFFVSTDQFPQGGLRVAIRSAGEDPSALAAAVRSALREEDPDIALSQVQTMDARIGGTLAQPRFRTGLVGAFALVGLALAAVGLYGVPAYLVTLRRHEIGIRMAVGADRGAVLGLILREGMRMVGAGLILGLIGGGGVSILLRGLLFGVLIRRPSAPGGQGRAPKPPPPSPRRKGCPGDAHSLGVVGMAHTRAAARSAGAAQLLAVLPFFLACFAPAPARAQEPSASEAMAHLWGRITTQSGEVHEGFIRWDRNEASWVDLLNGSKTLHGVQTRPWIPVGGAARNERVIEFGGYRISWEEEEPDLASVTQSGVRLGHVHRIRVLGEDSAAVELRSGAMLVMTMGSTDLGSDLREVLVEAPGGGVVALEWEDLAEVVLGPAPADARPRSARLHGTVEDRWGGSHTGYIAWDGDQALTSDTLEGEETRGRERRIPFREIASMERTASGALIALTGGDTLRLGWGRGVDMGTDLQVSDPGLGQVQVRWRDVETVRFHPPSPDVEAAASRDAFDGGRALEGTVVTVTGEELSGSILWDADEGATWEILDGRWRDITYDVELGKVASIERVTAGGRGEFRGVRATLLDGRVLELSGSNDVDAGNRGVLVRAAGESPSDAEPPPWVRVRWTDFRSVRFHH